MMTSEIFIRQCCLFVAGRNNSNEASSSFSGSQVNLVDDSSINLPAADDEITLTCIPSEESHYSELLPMAITTSIAQGLPCELPPELTNEEISQTNNPYSDEEEIQKEPLLSTALFGITDTINHSSQQVINDYRH